MVRSLQTPRGGRRTGSEAKKTILYDFFFLRDAVHALLVVVRNVRRADRVARQIAGEEFLGRCSDGGKP